MHPTQVHLSVCYAQGAPSPSCLFHHPMVCSPTQLRTWRSLLVLQQVNQHCKCGLQGAISISVGHINDWTGQFPSVLVTFMTELGNFHQCWTSGHTSFTQKLVMNTDTHRKQMRTTLKSMNTPTHKAETNTNHQENGRWRHLNDQALSGHKDTGDKNNVPQNSQAQNKTHETKGTAEPKETKPKEAKGQKHKEKSPWTEASEEHSKQPG